MPFRGAPCALLRPKAEASFEYKIKFPCIIKIALKKYSLESYLEKKLYVTFTCIGMKFPEKEMRALLEIER